MPYSTNTIHKVSLVREPSTLKKVKISCSGDINSYVRQFYNGDIDVYESMFIILLNRANIIIGYAKISQGGTIGTIADIKIIVKYALDSLAESVILVHNHPSGNNKPSESDRSLTKRVKEALKLFDINLLDHIIIVNTDPFIIPQEPCYSFADNGEL